jgi:carbonic anhydrase
MRTILILSLIANVAFGYTNKLSPADALDRLIKGNERYAKDELEHPNRTSERREASQSVQFPYAVIVGCSDSRVSPEIIFDEGVGDLFVVRVAGNVVGPLELESIEYSVGVLGSVMVLVMGHENCGAVKTVLDGQGKAIPAIAKMITPAIKDTKALPNAVKANALQVKNFLLNTGTLGKLAKDKKIDIRAAYYNLQSGKVELL